MGVVSLQHTVWDLTPGRFGYALGDMPVILATAVVSAITLCDAKVQLGSWLRRRWWVVASLSFDDDLVVVDLVFLPRSVRDLVALDGGVGASRVWVSVGLATALPVDDALASHRHGEGGVGGRGLGSVVAGLFGSRWMTRRVRWVEQSSVGRGAV